MEPDSRRSDNWGSWSPRLFSGPRFNCEAAMIGTFNSLARAFSDRLMVEISCCRFSSRRRPETSPDISCR